MATVVSREPTSSQESSKAAVGSGETKTRMGTAETVIASGRQDHDRALPCVSDVTLACGACRIFLGGVDKSLPGFAAARSRGRLHPGYVGGEEWTPWRSRSPRARSQMLGGAGVGVSGEYLGVAERASASRALVIAACRSECGLMCRGDAGRLGDPDDHPVGVAAVDRFPASGCSTSGPPVRSPRQTSSARRAGAVSGMVAVDGAADEAL